jgi:hypothetical protein
MKFKEIFYKKDIAGSEKPKKFPNPQLFFNMKDLKPAKETYDHIL